MTEFKIKELDIGKAGEHLVCADLIIKGYNAFLSAQGLAYDVIVETVKGLKAIQVKTTTKRINYSRSRNVYRFGLRNGNKRNSRRISCGVIDYIACVALDIRKIAYVPIVKISQDGLIKLCIEFRLKSDPKIEKVYSPRYLKYNKHKYKDFVYKFMEDYDFEV